MKSRKIGTRDTGLDLEAPLRFPGRPQQTDQKPLVNASNDDELAEVWLKAKAGNSKATQDAYKKEIRRLKLWCALERDMALTAMKADDCAAYLDWLTKIGGVTESQWRKQWRIPQASWVSERKTSLQDANWRPFYRKQPQEGRVGGTGSRTDAGGRRPYLSTASLAQALRVLRGFFQYASVTEYVRSNPWKTIRGPATSGIEKFSERSLSDEEVRELDAWIDAINDMEVQSRLRTALWLGTSCGLRIGEMTRLTLGSIKQDPGTPWWSLKVMGKGQKKRDLRVPTPVMRAIELNLNSRGIGLMEISKRTNEPLLESRRRRGGHLTTGGLHALMKSMFEACARDNEAKADSIAQTIRLAGTRGMDKKRMDRMRDQAMTYRAKAERLKAASTHWLRHTYGRYAVEQQVPINVVQLTMGHKNVSTTSTYIRATADRAAAEMERLAQLRQADIEKEKRRKRS